MPIDQQSWKTIVSSSSYAAAHWTEHGIADVLPHEEIALPSRFDGVYGGLYDTVIHHRQIRSAAGLLWGRGSALSFLDELFDRAFAGLHADDMVLDVPCGGGTTIRAAADRGIQTTIIGCDLSMAMLERAQRVAESCTTRSLLVRADALHLPFRDHCMQRAISINGLHCIDDPSALLSELARVLVPGGELWMTTLVSSDSRRHMAIMAAAHRAGIIPGPAPTRQAIERMARTAGFDQVDDMGGVGIAALRLTTQRRDAVSDDPPSRA